MRSECPEAQHFSNANRTRNPEIAEDLYWQMMKHLQSIFPSFTQGGKYGGFISRVKRDIFAIDSTTLKLTMNSFDWARHRRKKAAAKTHMRIDVSNMLPCFAVMENAAHHDSTRGDELCASLKDGDILLADRAYVKFSFTLSNWRTSSRQGWTFKQYPHINSQKMAEIFIFLLLYAHALINI